MKQHSSHADQYKVFIEHIPPALQQPAPADSMNDFQANPAPNLSILVKDVVSQEEWTGKAQLNEGFIDRLQKWVSKGKYTCTKFTNEIVPQGEEARESAPPQVVSTEMELRVQIFKF